MKDVFADEYVNDGGMLVEADHMTPSDAVFVPKPFQDAAKPALCKFEGCMEITIFGMCRAHEKEMELRLIAELDRQGWKRVLGEADESSGHPTPATTS